MTGTISETVDDAERGDDIALSRQGYEFSALALAEYAQAPQHFYMLGSLVTMMPRQMGIATVLLNHPDFIIIGNLA